MKLRNVRNERLMQGSIISNSRKDGKIHSRKIVKKISFKGPTLFITERTVINHIPSKKFHQSIETNLK